MNLAVRSIPKNFMLAFAAMAMLGSAAYAAEPAVVEDPAALAASFEKQAVELRASAEKHDKMAQAHRGGAGSSKVNHEGIVQHCKGIAENLRAAARESDAAAAEYRKAAQK
jgi:hypothetical protein